MPTKTNRNWQTKKLGEVCEVIAGQSPEGKFYNQSKNGLPFYQGKKQFTGKFIGAPTTWTVKVTKEALAGDILLSVRAPVGPVNFATEKICIGRGLAAIRANKEINTEYLFYFLKELENEIVGNSGAVFNSINKKQIEVFPIPLPPLPEQKRIVKILDEVFAKLETAKKNAEKNLQNAKELFESYLQSIFANGGDDWEEKKLGELGILQTGTTPKTSEKENIGDFIPFIKPSDFNKDGSINYNNFGLSKIGSKKSRIIEKNSVLMVCIGATIGKTGFTEKAIACNQQINSLTLDSDYYPKFFYYAMITKKNQSNVIKNSGQATLPIINKTKWSKLKISFPKSLKIQKQIVAKLDTLSEQTRKLEKNYRQKIADMDELKKSILQKAFAGKL